MNNPDSLIRQYIAALIANKPEDAAAATKAMVDYALSNAQTQKMPIEYSIDTNGYLRFSVGVQSFTLDYIPEDEEFQYMKDMLNKAFSNMEIVQQKPWVDLTPEEYDYIIKTQATTMSRIKAVEAVLRVKNS